MESLLLGAALGLFAGIVPGPFLTLVATTSLRDGLSAGIKVALVPLVTETPVFLTSILVLTQLSEGVLRWIGVGGGLLMLYTAWSVDRDARKETFEPDALPSLRGHLFRVALVGVMAPAPWVFWFLIAGPLFLSRWHVSPWHGLAFVLAFFAFFVGAMSLVAWLVSRGRQRLSPEWQRRTLRVAAGIIAVVGLVLIWQSWVGNFSDLVQPQREIQNVVGAASERI